MRLLMGFVFALLLAGCSDADKGKRIDLPSDMTVHPSFGAQAEIVIAAADEWKRATGGVADLNPRIGNNGTVKVRETFDDSADWAGDTDSAAWEADIRIDLPGLQRNATRDKRSIDDELRDTVMHELGHAMGIGHLPSGLMRSSGYGGGCVDAAALAAFCENYRCPASAAQTCD